MKIKVKLHTILTKYAKNKILENNTVILDEETTLQGLTDYLDIPEKVGIMFLINDFPREKDYRLCEGDEAKLFSLICGG